MSAATLSVAAVPHPQGRKVPREKCPLLARECLRDFNAKELEFIANFKSGELNVEPGTNVLLRGTNSAHLYTNYPSLAFDVTWLASREEQILDENLLSIGRRTSMERIAFLLHLFLRAEEIGLAKNDTIQFPFTQQHVADTLGMSLVHTNNALTKIARYSPSAQRARRPFI